MQRTVLLTGLLGALIVAGCGGDDDDDGDDITRQAAEKIAVAQAPDGGADSASCVELAEDRQFRCGLRRGSITSYYEVIVSEDGKVAQFIER